jgi:hypothetical protein
MRTATRNHPHPRAGCRHPKGMNAPESAPPVVRTQRTLPESTGQYLRRIPLARDKLATLPRPPIIGTRDRRHPRRPPSLDSRACLIHIWRCPLHNSFLRLGRVRTVPLPGSARAEPRRGAVSHLTSTAGRFRADSTQRFAPGAYGRRRDDSWELYYRPEDFSQAKNLVADQPDELAERMPSRRT